MKNEKARQNAKVAVTVTAITLLAVFLELLRRIYLGAGCLFKALLGIACPACGMTRAYTALLRLDFASAFYYNPAWWTVPVAGLLCILAAADKKRSKLWLKIFALDVLVLICVWLFRLATNTTV